jgi:large subunit ribosomal protein L24
VQKPCGIVKKEAAIQISNISLIDPKQRKQLELELKKVRFSKKSNQVL